MLRVSDALWLEYIPHIYQIKELQNIVVNVG